MSLSFITPHFNDIEGLRHIYNCLQKQTLSTWDWVIVDDKSEPKTITKLKQWHETLKDNKIQLLLNSEKTNASVCRNLGVDLALSDRLVFLDADDLISNEFVHNRQLEFTDFAVFINYSILNENGEEIIKKNTQDNYLNNFLAAKFLWQTSCILWSRSFFKKIEKFNSELLRLQDIELTVRALQQSTRYSVIDNPIDFYYKTKPIKERKNFVLPVCNAVHLFVSKLLETKDLSVHQISLISGYYFLCVRYFVSSGSKTHASLLQRNLKLFYSRKHISFKGYILGYILLKIYLLNILTGRQFVRANRYLFKPKQLRS